MKRLAPRITISILFISLLLGGCTQDHNETEKNLVSFVKNAGFEVPPVFLETQGTFLSADWYKVTLYFGYADNGNWIYCLEDAKRLNQVAYPRKFRCNGAL